MAPFIEADTDQVYDAGRRTAATSTTWETWRCDVQGELAYAAQVVSDDHVLSAISTAAGDTNTLAAQLVTDVESLGVNTTLGAAAVDDANHESCQLHAATLAQTPIYRTPPTAGT